MGLDPLKEGQHELGRGLILANHDKLGTNKTQKIAHNVNELSQNLSSTFEQRCSVIVKQ